MSATEDLNEMNFHEKSKELRDKIMKVLDGQPLIIMLPALSSLFCQIALECIETGAIASPKTIFKIMNSLEKGIKEGIPEHLVECH